LSWKKKKKKRVFSFDATLVFWPRAGAFGKSDYSALRSAFVV